MQVKEFFDPNTSTLTYCVYNQGDAVIIDPVLDYDPVNCKVSSDSVNKVFAFVKQKNLKVKAIMETHVHADHWTGAAVLKRTFSDAPVVIGKNIELVLKNFAFLFEHKQPLMSEVFDLLIKEGDRLEFGAVAVDVLETPGHTPCCLSYKIDDFIFVGDLLFLPDSGTGRCDFPGGDAELLFNSVREKIYTLPENVKVYSGHDYQPGGRELKFCATVADHKKNNIRLSESTTKEDFIKFRRTRDETLSLPKLIFSSLQINLRSGQLGDKDKDGRRFLKTPYWD